MSQSAGSWCNATRIVVQCRQNRGAMPPESWCNVTGIVVQCHRILQHNEGVEIFNGVNARIWANPVSCSHITFFVGCSLLPPNRKSTGIRTIRTTPTLRGANQSSRTETHTPNPLLPLDLHYSIRNVHPNEVRARFRGKLLRQQYSSLSCNFRPQEASKKFTLKYQEKN